MDAPNAFNSIDRNDFLHNITIICPAIATYAKSCYFLHSQLFIIGGSEIRSCEGTTQGDPIAMAVYAIAIIPMILIIVDINSKLMILQKLQPMLMTLGLIPGRKFGYYPEANHG